MCATCGCSATGAQIEGGIVDVSRVMEHPLALKAYADDVVPRTLTLERDILSVNDGFAAANRARLAETRTLALNLMSSPGSGKTSLLVETLEAIGDVPAVVIEGDQQTSNDAERIRATGRQAVQINTGKGCHLDGKMVAQALARLEFVSGGLLFIENVGNLVCPAAFDLGEAKRVVMLSTTEGNDKPLKYPDMFARADLVIITKADLAPYVDFDEGQVRAALSRINPAADVIMASIKTRDGLLAWLNWLAAQRSAISGQG